MASRRFLARGDPAPLSAGASLLAVALGGAVGATLRWLVTLGVARTLAPTPAASFPVGTLLVNVVGCFLLAWLLAAGPRTGLGSWSRLFLGTGVLGALTTFSTYGLDAHGLVVQGRAGAALLYVGGTLVLAGLAVMLGWGLGRTG